MRSPTVSRVGSGVPRGAADQRLHARQQLGERERLGQVVVAARLQPADAIVDGVAALRISTGVVTSARRSSSISEQPIAASAA